MPCQPNSVSVNVAPVNTAASEKANSVPVGISAVRRACLNTAAPLRQPLGPGGADVVGVQRVEHQVALVAAVDGDARDRQRERRQQQVLAAVEHAGDERAVA